ncbi:chromosome partitioning protein ParA [Ferrimonas sp. YFM]|uniref:AAA family ATPase n=1 Tax=Ferrimonas sp. YFM TaxID=3028878 RepID=UPI002572683F|nr:chromosome partitioning protein ParA [Ferrimonas sp. YFM]BDY04209.1 chromosome partitioning ATPase [Ferrimonas sp. YFM]
MFDLAKAISANTKSEPQERGPAGFSLFYQTPECHNLVQEVCRFEGWPEPHSQKESQGINPEKLQDIVILELNDSDNVVADARQFASQMPNKKGIIIIGKEDAITTMRALKEMGFYYLFWPVGKQELTEFLRHVHANQQKFSGVSQNRKAKRISVVGTRGGCGTTLIATELASALAGSGAETVLVDHKYQLSNIDIILGQKDLAKQDVKNISLQLHELDEDAAFSYLTKVSRRLNLLGLTGDAPQRELTEFTHSLCDLLLRQANFMVEDYSASIDFPLEMEALYKRSDMIVLVLEPSVTSLRNGQQLLEQVAKFNLDGGDDTRLLLVANYHRPESSFSLSLQEMHQFLEREMDIVIPYNKQTAHLVLEGRRLHKQESGKQKPLTTLYRLINGQLAPQKSTPLSLFKEVFKR